MAVNPLFANDWLAKPPATLTLYSALDGLRHIEYDLYVVAVLSCYLADTRAQFANSRIYHDVCKHCQACTLRLGHLT
jgi:hypothetical protein